MSARVVPLLLLGACTLSEPVIKLPAGGARSMLTIEVPERGEARADAIALDGGAMLEPYVAYPVRDAKSTLYVLRYHCALSALALDPGPVKLAAAGTGRALPGADQILTTDILGETFSELVPADPAALASIRIDQPANMSSPCVRFDTDNFVFGGDGRSQLRFMVSLGGKNALAATADGLFFELSHEKGMAQLTGLSTNTPHLGAYRDRDGTTWLAGKYGLVASGDPRTALNMQPSLTSTLTGTQIWLDGADTGSPFELFAVTAARTFERFDGARWTRLHATEGEQIASHGGVAWVAPGEAFAIGLTGAKILHARGDNILEESLPLPPGDIPDVLTRVPGFGLVIGSEAGVLIHRTGDRWEPILDAGGGFRIYVIGPLDAEGLIFGGRQGQLTQYHPGTGTCPVDQITAGDISFLAPIEGGLAIGAIIVGQADVAELLRPLAPAQNECPP